MSKTLTNKVALITGSSRGIGRATALAMAKAGASLIGVHYASNADAAQATVREIEALGSKAVAIGADLKNGKAAVDLAERRPESPLSRTCFHCTFPASALEDEETGMISLNE